MAEDLAIKSINSQTGSPTPKGSADHDDVIAFNTIQKDSRFKPILSLFFRRRNRIIFGEGVFVVLNCDGPFSRRSILNSGMWSSK